MPSPIVSVTLTAVNTTVRSSVCQKTLSCSTELKLANPTGTPWCRISSNSPYRSVESLTSQ